MDVPFWVWAITIAAIVGMLLFDFVGHVRTPHAPSLREAATWSAVYVGIAVVFGILVFVFAGAQYGGEYFAGYITEKSLSVDNLFVFVLIMASFGVPAVSAQPAGLVLTVDSATDGEDTNIGDGRCARADGKRDLRQYRRRRDAARRARAAQPRGGQLHRHHDYWRPRAGQHQRHRAA